jgi:hypothetical protein
LADLQWIADLARAVGVPGAAVLIFIAGIAFKFHKILETIRIIIKDHREQNRLDRELQARIDRESHKRRLEIEKIKGNRATADRTQRR